MDRLKNVALPFAAVVSTVAVAHAEAPVAVVPAQRPNVVMIYVDDLGFGDLECYGAKGVNAPNINSLSSGSLRFANAHRVASTSTPSRYSLLTGEYPWRKPGTDVAADNTAMVTGSREILEKIKDNRGFWVESY